jgi:hypothetical protein
MLQRENKSLEYLRAVHDRFSQLSFDAARTDLLTMQAQARALRAFGATG